MPREDKREIQERLNMWDDLMEKDPKMRKPDKLNLLLDQIAIAPDEDAARSLLDLVAA